MACKAPFLRHGALALLAQGTGLVQAAEPKLQACLIR